jgi:hypothetical protein
MTQMMSLVGGLQPRYIRRMMHLKAGQLASTPETSALHERSLATSSRKALPANISVSHGRTVNTPARSRS